MNAEDASTAEGFVQKHAPVLMVHLNTSFEVTETNDYTRRLLGRDVAGEPISTIILNFDRGLSQALVSERSGQHRVSVVTSSGVPETFFCRFASTEGGYLVLGSVDPVEQDRLRTQLLSLNSELANKTRALHKANTELARLNAVKNEFLGMVSHDLRKPVGVVLSYSEFLTDEASDDLGDEHRGFVETIYAAAEYMHRVIDDYLDVAMIEAGRFDIAPTPGELLQVVHRAIDLTRVSARRHEVTVALEGGELGTMRFDAAKMEQVVINLLANAIEHSPPGATVHVRALVEDDAAVVRVKDRAGGIPETEIHGLFEAYARASTKKRGKAKSIGLGLAIARKIVEAHNGTIGVESEAGEGSTFTVRIPVEGPRPSL